MIFVTVGNLDPFDRLVRAVDEWAARRGGGEEIVAQIGTGRYRPTACRSVEFLPPSEFRDLFARARFVVSHAGMGTIITAVEFEKPIVVMPKRASLGEQRNEHQLATVRRFRRSGHVLVAETEVELAGLLDRMGEGVPASGGSEEGKTRWPPDPRLIEFVRGFVSGSAGGL